MTQEEKSLLLKDLCARLSYRIKGIITYNKSNTTFTVEGIDNNILHLSDTEECYVEDFKPYLRPMSSMTKEERQEMEKTIGSNPIEPFGTLTDTCDNLVCSCAYGSYLMLQYLYSHHFDILNLIEKDLALEALEGMYT